jgi:hypothetical protein
MPRRVFGGGVLFWRFAHLVARETDERQTSKRNTQRSETMQICMGNVQMLRDKKPFFQSGADCAIIFTNTAILNKKLEKSGGFFVSLTPTHSISISYSARIGKGIVRSTRGFLACCP